MGVWGASTPTFVSMTIVRCKNLLLNTCAIVHSIPFELGINGLLCKKYVKLMPGSYTKDVHKAEVYWTGILIWQVQGNRKLIPCFRSF